MAFPCHLLNFWRSPILLWQPQQRARSSARPQLETQIDRSGSSSRKSSSCPTNVYTGGLKINVLTPYNCGELWVRQEKLGGSNQWMCELELEPPIQLLVLNEEVGLAKLDVHPTWFSSSPISWVYSSSTQDRCDEPSNTKLSSSLVPSVVSCDLVGEELVKEGIKFPVSDLSPLILLPSLCVREGLDSHVKKLEFPLVDCPGAFLAKKVLASALCTYLKTGLLI
ncbi:unnamed protein product [Microthlaspi erraticum]|uniref:Uncharacterized protein n=1 Tax=Microthlaspi erraticum TaxID=1685480 RepID=A0A6D2IB15_9BRAS|nr:unnamed protein product [Microthlaspi erraticum]